MSKILLFLGIGGMGMAPLAYYIRQRGDIVYGFDDALSSDLELFFESQKIIICEEFPRNIDCIIFSSAISQNHPWMQMAQKEKIPTIRRGFFLAQFCGKKKVIAVTGSHGKTTTTGMLIDHFPHCDYILGGFFQNKEKLPAFYSKESKYLICEVDESDHTIQSFHPHITATINLEDDHVKEYGQSRDLDAAFETLFSQTRHAVVIPNNNERLRNIAQKLQISIFFAEDSVVKNNDDQQSCSENRAIVQKILEIMEKEENSPKILTKVSSSPIFRRNQFLGNILTRNHRIEVWTDYAHHPTEISHQIKKFENAHPDRKILFIFQPHRYSRTRQYAREFAEIFADKEVIFLPVYSAGEEFLPNATTHSILKNLTPCKKVRYMELLENFEIQKFSKTDIPHVIVFIGAGDIYQRAQDWLLTQNIFYFKKRLGEHSIVFEENFSLKYHNTLQIDGTAVLWIEPQFEKELQIIIQELQIFDISYLIIGHGSNLLLDDFKGVFISLKKILPIFEIDQREVTVSSGISLFAFSKRMANLGFQGCEELAGIPGSIGGALYMNAGAHQQSIFDFLISITFLDHSGAIKTIPKEHINFGYRHGFCKGIILSAKFYFPQTESPQLLLDKIKAKAQWRREKQPFQPNVGSIFKNPENNFAGELIEKAGLKGISVGGSKISEKHANFIVNANGKATAKDIKKLLRLVRQKLFEANGIFLEREILFASDEK